MSEEQIDITGPQIVEILIREGGEVVWVNVDGICRFRACRIRHIQLNDEREQEPLLHDRDPNFKD